MAEIILQGLISPNPYHFPLLSVVLTGIFVLGVSSELYAAIVAVNSAIFVIISHDVSDFVFWFFAFEISVITTFSTLSAESRSFRRSFAFFVLIICTFVGAIFVYLLLNLSSITKINPILALSLGSGVLLVKIPAIPFSIWLPEAHVEASWPGSVVLACFALKFATVALITFSISRLHNLDFVLFVLVASGIFSAFSMTAISDMKKIVANFSILHMSLTAGILLFSGASNSDAVQSFSLLFSWHHHSAITGGIFVIIGWGYAFSGSRMFRFVVSNVASFPLLFVILFIFVTFSLDMPWTSNVFVELEIVRGMSGYFFIFGGVLALTFWILLVGISVIGQTSSSNALGNSPSGTSGTLDFPAQSNFMLFSFCFGLSLVGFGIVLQIFSNI